MTPAAQTNEASTRAVSTGLPSLRLRCLPHTSAAASDGSPECGLCPPSGRARGGRLPAPGSRLSGIQLQLLLVFAESQHELLFVVEALCIVYLLRQLDGEDLRFHVDHRLLVGRAGDGHATT